MSEGVAKLVPFVLRWLGDGDGGLLGECQGAPLDVLTALRLAEVGAQPPGRDPLRAVVTLTPLGRDVLAGLKGSA